MATDHTGRTARGSSAPAGWTFEVVEISNGGWECRGVDGDGRQVSRQGSDPELLLPGCWEAAEWVNGQLDGTRESKVLERRRLGEELLTFVSGLRDRVDARSYREIEEFAEQSEWELALETIGAVTTSGSLSLSSEDAAALDFLRARLKRAWR